MRMSFCLVRSVKLKGLSQSVRGGGGGYSTLHRTETKYLFTYSRFSTAALLEMIQHFITQSGGCVFPRINRSRGSNLYFSNVIYLGIESVFPMGCINWKRSKLSL